MTGPEPDPGCTSGFGSELSSGFAFEVRPQALTEYAESLQARAADLAAVGEALAAVRVERGWFGKLPQSGYVADCYAAHQDGVLAEAGELTAWLAAAVCGLAESAGRYSAADRVVAGVADAVRTALPAGTELPAETDSEDSASSDEAFG